MLGHSAIHSPAMQDEMGSNSRNRSGPGPSISKGCNIVAPSILGCTVLAQFGLLCGPGSAGWGCLQPVYVLCHLLLESRQLLSTTSFSCCWTWMLGFVGSMDSMAVSTLQNAVEFIRHSGTGAFNPILCSLRAYLQGWLLSLAHPGFRSGRPL